MTGELSVYGKALPVGGVSQKIDAAAKAGLKRVIIPAEIQDRFVEKPVRVIPVESLDEALALAFGRNWPRRAQGRGPCWRRKRRNIRRGRSVRAARCRCGCGDPALKQRVDPVPRVPDDDGRAPGCRPIAYLSLARAPFAPARLAPTQFAAKSRTFSISASGESAVTSVTSVPGSAGSR